MRPDYRIAGHSATRSPPAGPQGPRPESTPRHKIPARCTPHASARRPFNPTRPSGSVVLAPAIGRITTINVLDGLLVDLRVSLLAH